MACEAAMVLFMLLLLLIHYLVQVIDSSVASI